MNYSIKGLFPVVTWEEAKKLMNENTKLIPIMFVEGAPIYGYIQLYIVVPDIYNIQFKYSTIGTFLSKLSVQPNTFYHEGKQLCGFKVVHSYFNDSYNYLTV
jgi:hypothetical protein